MASDYISRQDAADLLTMALDDDWEVEYAKDRLNEIPTADVVEWVPTESRPTQPTDYIKRGHALNAVCHDEDNCDCPDFGCDLYRRVKRIKAADVIPVEWILKQDGGAELVKRWNEYKEETK